MKKLTTVIVTSSLIVTLTRLWPLSHATTGPVELDGLVMTAHIIDIRQANATLLEFPCEAALIDTGAQDEEKVDELVRFLNDLSTLSESGSVKLVS